MNEFNTIHKRFFYRKRTLKLNHLHVRSIRGIPIAYRKYMFGCCYAKSSDNATKNTNAGSGEDCA